MTQAIQGVLLMLLVPTYEGGDPSVRAAALARAEWSKLGESEVRSIWKETLVEFVCLPTGHVSCVGLVTDRGECGNDELVLEDVGAGPRLARVQLVGCEDTEAAALRVAARVRGFAGLPKDSTRFEGRRTLSEWSDTQRSVRSQMETVVQPLAGIWLVQISWQRSPLRDKD